MSVAVAPTESAVFKALGDFLLSVVAAGIEIVQSQDNRVPEPSGANFITMNMVRQERLGTNLVTPLDFVAGTQTVTQETKVTIQVDVHGPLGADQSNIISTLFRDSFAVDFFDANSPGIDPLYCEDPRQIPFVDAEQQIEDRWIIDVHLQVNPAVIVAQLYANTLKVSLYDVEAPPPPPPGSGPSLDFSNPNNSQYQPLLP